jgi:hypothetical protein
MEQQPQYVQVRPTNGMAVASLVLGIVGILLFLWVIPSILAIIFGAIGVGQSSMRGGRTMALWGLWLGIAGPVLFIVVFVAAMS